MRQDFELFKSILDLNKNMPQTQKWMYSSLALDTVSVLPTCIRHPTGHNMLKYSILSFVK